MTEPNPAPEAPAKPAAPPPKVEVPSLPPAEMFSQELKDFISACVRSGDEVVVEIGKSSFTGKIFRTMIHEGWIALEHVDGRRKAFMVIEGGKIRAKDGKEFAFPGGHGK